MFLRISYFKKHFDSCFLVPTYLGEQENTTFRPVEPDILPGPVAQRPRGISIGANSRNRVVPPREFRLECGSVFKRSSSPTYWGSEKQVPESVVHDLRCGPV